MFIQNLMEQFAGRIGIARYLERHVAITRGIPLEEFMGMSERCRIVVDAPQQRRTFDQTGILLVSIVLEASRLTLSGNHHAARDTGRHLRLKHSKTAPEGIFCPLLLAKLIQLRS